MSTKIGKGKNLGAVDHWLDTLGLYRKNVAYDETCLFRAISEQLFDCQVHHERVRTECITFARKNPQELIYYFDSNKHFFEHLNKLEKHMVICGDLELKIVSKKYNRSIKVFNANDQQIYHPAGPEFENSFLLCLIDKDHYDVVYKKEQIRAAGFCQSIVYKILYEEVYQMPEVDEIVHKMLYDKGNIVTEAELVIEKRRILESCSEELTEEQLEEKIEEKKKCVVPFPFKIAKALDPNVYRNIEYDTWSETRREWRLGEWYYGDNKLILGTKCIYNDDSNKKFDCYIQEIIKNKNKCVVYLTKTAERRTVDYSDLSPEDNAQPWPLPYRFSKSVVVTPTTPPTEKVPSKNRRRNRDKKRTKSESSVLSSTTAVKYESLADNIEAYVGVPLRMQSPPRVDNSTFCQTGIPNEVQADPTNTQENTILDNAVADENRWYSNGYQWPSYVPSPVDPFVWPTSPTTNQNYFNYNLKPMVASAPVTPHVIPYHDSNYNYFNYHVDSYPTFPQWSTSFELEPPPPPRNQQEKVPEPNESNTPINSNEFGYTSNENNNGFESSNVRSSGERTLKFSPPSPYPQPCAPCTPVEMYSPVSPVVQMPGPTMMYTTAPPEVAEVVIVSTPVIYASPLEGPHMPTSPYVYPPTPPPTWYPAGITPQGFIFP